MVLPGQGVVGICMVTIQIQYQQHRDYNQRKTIRRNIMTTKTKLTTKNVPTKTTIRKCFVCSAKIAPGISLGKPPKPRAEKVAKVSATSIACKSSPIPLYRSKTRKILGYENPIKPRHNGFNDQNPLPNGEINATNKLLGYENERKTH